MRGLTRILILLLVMVALPLRGVAAVAADVCAAHHGGALSAHADGHDHGSGHEPDAPDSDHSSKASICSLCATCSVGATLAPEPSRPVATALAGADRIPFFDARKPGHVPDHPDRPPLVS